MATIDGTTGNDVLYSGSDSDRFNMFGGDDTVVAGSGNDTVYAGDGHDAINGGNGNDTLFGESGNDDLDGDQGADTLYGGDGNDTLDGDEGSDLVYGGAGDDIIHGEDPAMPEGSGEADTLHGDAGNDIIISTDTDFNVIYGGSDDDFVWEGVGSAFISGGTGNDTLFAGDGNDTVFGGTGNDLIQGEEGQDTLYGGDGQDVFNFSNAAEADTIFGGSGGDDLDTMDFFASNDVSVTFAGDEFGSYSQAGGSTSGSFTEIERFFTYGGADAINATNTDSAVSIYSGDGNDTLRGGTADDVIFYGAGEDLVYGGAGDDFIDDLSSPTIGSNILFGDAGNDSVWAGSDADTVYGGTGNDSINANSGNDYVQGDAGDDVIKGFWGEDTVYGGAGNDTLFGGNEDDTLYGGTGEDTFGFLRDGSSDSVVDFDTGDTDADGFYNDQLDVSALRTLGGAPVTTGDVVVDNDGFGNARLTFPEGEVIILQGVSPAQMATPTQLHAAGIPCFTTGTLIMTPQGPQLIESLRPGDLVNTRDNGPRPVAWIGQRHVTTAELMRNPQVRPVRIAAGLYGNECPLLVSPQHGLLMKSARGDEHLVRAIHLARLHGGKVRVAHGVRQVTYVHLLFEAHQVVMTDGVSSESFYPGPWALRGLRRPEMQELAKLFPVLGRAGVRAQMGGTARRFAKFRELPRRLARVSTPLL